MIIGKCTSSDSHDIPELNGPSVTAFRLIAYEGGIADLCDAVVSICHDAAAHSRNVLLESAAGDRRGAWTVKFNGARAAKRPIAVQYAIGHCELRSLDQQRTT